MSAKYVLFYASNPDAIAKAPLHFPAHRASIDEFHARGELLLIGTFSRPVEEGAMAVFTTRGAAEAFAKDDPFVLQGIVKDWHIQEWNEILG